MTASELTFQLQYRIQCSFTRNILLNSHRIQSYELRNTTSDSESRNKNAHKTIGAMVRNFLDAENCTPQSSCSQTVRQRNLPWSAVSNGVPFSICSTINISYTSTQKCSHSMATHNYILNISHTCSLSRKIILTIY